jgi:hypothetical protein
MPMPANGQHGRATSEDTLDLIRRLARHHDETTIRLSPRPAVGTISSGQPSPARP